jgi:uncharacterized protein YoxC
VILLPSLQLLGINMTTEPTQASRINKLDEDVNGQSVRLASVETALVNLDQNMQHNQKHNEEIQKEILSRLNKPAPQTNYYAMVGALLGILGFCGAYISITQSPIITSMNAHTAVLTRNTNEIIDGATQREKIAGDVKLNAHSIAAVSLRVDTRAARDAETDDRVYKLNGQLQSLLARMDGAERDIRSKP